MIRVITIEREYGSGAPGIAKKLAERLGWELWDQRLTDEIARQLDCDRRAVEEHAERVDPLYYRMFKAFLRGSFEGSLNAPRLKLVDAECIRAASEQLVGVAANAGKCVIVGRGSAYHLRDRADAFHIFLYAPFEAKVNRLMAEGRSENEAVELVDNVDRDRSEYIKRSFDIDWPARHFFQLMINTALGDDLVVRTILQAVALADEQGMPPPR